MRTQARSSAPKSRTGCGTWFEANDSSGFILSCGPDINSLYFKNDLEAQYFDQWSHISRSFLGGYSSSKLWAVFMPQITRQDPVLRDAAIAIGAMSRAMSISCAGGHVEKTLHHTNAVDHYCKALRLQAQTSLESLDMQSLMLGSILFICFEAFRSNPKAALQHIARGTPLLQQLFTHDRSSSHIRKIAPDPWELLHEISRVYVYLGVQTQTVMSGRLDSSQSAIRTLAQDLQTKGCNVERVDANFDYFLNPRREIDLDCFPDSFSTLAEASEHWTLTERKIQKYFPQVMASMPSLIKLKDTFQDVDSFFDQLERQAEMDIFVRRAHHYLESWYRPFKPLCFSASRNHSSNPDLYHQTTYLHLQYLELYVFILFPKQGNYNTVNALTPTFRQMNGLCEQLAKSCRRELGADEGVFSMQSTVLWRLMFIAMNCRDADTRNEAIRIMDKYPHRDGIWNNHAFLAIAEQNRKLEVENAKEGSEHEQWRRLCWRVFRFEDAGTRVVFRSMRKTDSWSLVEEIADLEQVERDGWKNARWERVPLHTKHLMLQWGRTTGMEAFRDPSRLSTGCVSLNIT
ncbi:unnamed protein product [Clonostachys solani]|uniref:Transcription factor domain-containing protein n=1 Tax=Clonostachys solani TaxID=160281 RepID=A0A9N9Z0A0_9HYPO|nr:unnamed protein product [Clonostachys solani]